MAPDRMVGYGVFATGLGAYFAKFRADPSIRLRQEGFQPGRDLILGLTADEEGGRVPNGVRWLLEHRRTLIDADFCVNTDAGGGQARDGRPGFLGF
jgi:hypothetical protein